MNLINVAQRNIFIFIFFSGVLTLKLKDFFNMIDEDASGEVNADELASYMREMGEVGVCPLFVSTL